MHLFTLFWPVWLLSYFQFGLFLTILLLASAGNKIIKNSHTLKHDNNLTNQN